MLKSFLKTRLRRFSAETDGYITVEAMIVLPVLLLLFGASWVYFDVFHQQSVNQKINYVIGDMVSRETEELDDTYIDNTFRMLGVMNKTFVEPGMVTYPADMRITVVSYDADRDRYSVVWSAARGDHDALENNDIENYEDRLPVMADNTQTIVVETWTDYNPLFRVGLDAFEIKTYSFTHPRYAPQVLYAGAQGQNNGWGNGDQDAPGGSLCHNNAENATDCNNSDGSHNFEPSHGWGW